MKVLSFVSKYTIAFFIIAGIVITILMFNNNSDTSPENEFSIRQTTIGAKLVDLKSDKEFLISQTEKSEFKFRIDIWKDGHIYTTSSESVKDSALTVNTKYVSGTNKDQFGVHTDAIIKDDAGVVVYDNYLESGNPFE